MPGEVDRYERREPTAEEAVVIARLNAAFARRDAEEIGQIYTSQLRSSLRALKEGRGDDPTDPLDDWLMMVWDGHDPDGTDIDGEFWFDLVVAAADATQNDNEAWCIGDGPANHMVYRHLPGAEQLHALRSTHPGVESMFRVMQADIASMGYLDAGWWADGWSEPEE